LIRFISILFKHIQTMNKNINDSALLDEVMALSDKIRSFENQPIGDSSLVIKKADDLLSELANRGDQICDELSDDIRPKARELFKELNNQALHLKSELVKAFQEAPVNGKVNWSEIAKAWMRFAFKWVDSEKLKERIIGLAIDQTKYLIDRDLKVINDYQQQSIMPLLDDPSIALNIEKRLKTATQEALQQFTDLKNQPSNLNPDAASKWIKSIQIKRQLYFDKILLKIDSVLKEVTADYIHEDPVSIFEMNSELTFMEQELKYFARESIKIGSIPSGLRDLKEDLNNLKLRGIPSESLSRFNSLKKEMDLLLESDKREGL
jgi:hypothetical protein